MQIQLFYSEDLGFKFRYFDGSEYEDEDYLSHNCLGEKWLIPDTYQDGDTIDILDFNVDGPDFQILTGQDNYKEICENYYDDFLSQNEEDSDLLTESLDEKHGHQTININSTFNDGSLNEIILYRNIVIQINNQ